MKGKKKRRLTSFKKGHPYHTMHKAPKEAPDVPHHWKALNEADFKLATSVDLNGLITSNDVDGNPVPFKFLRPRTCNDEQNKVEVDIRQDNRLVNQIKMEEMWNKIFKDHSENTACESPHFKLLNETKKGVANAQQYICETCMFTTSYFKLYQVADIPNKVGPKFASPNIGISTVMQDTSIGVART